MDGPGTVEVMYIPPPSLLPQPLQAVLLFVKVTDVATRPLAAYSPPPALIRVSPESAVLARKFEFCSVILAPEYTPPPLITALLLENVDPLMMTLPSGPHLSRSSARGAGIVTVEGRIDHPGRTIQIDPAAVLTRVVSAEWWRFQSRQWVRLRESPRRACWQHSRTRWMFSHRQNPPNTRRRRPQ